MFKKKAHTETIYRGEFEKRLGKASTKKQIEFENRMLEHVRRVTNMAKKKEIEEKKGIWVIKDDSESMMTDEGWAHSVWCLDRIGTIVDFTVFFISESSANMMTQKCSCRVY